MALSLDEIRARVTKAVGPCPKTSKPVDDDDTVSRDLCRAMEEFDWLNHRSDGKSYSREKPYLMFHAPAGESGYDRKLRMLDQVQRSCMACSMCELGRKGVTRGEPVVLRDPHVFSNMKPSDIVVVAQNPGWEEVCKCEPLVGASGLNFFNETDKYGINRSDFYICNAVRCHTLQNEKPLQKHLDRCAPFLHIEMNLLRPKLVVALGAIAFEQLCPSYRFSDRLGDITYSDGYDVDVFAVYHPSPRNLEDKERCGMFEKQIKRMCLLIKAIRTQ